MMSPYLAELRSIVGARPLMLSSAAGVVSDDAGRILLGRHEVGGHWVIPGGIIDPGETPAQAMVREVREETGLTVSPTELLGVWGGTAEHHVTYPNGHEVDFLLIAFEARVVGGRLDTASEELTELGWYQSTEIRSLDTAPWMVDILAALDDPNHRFRV
jgi:8-oxo-dGTP pyrophosphatase MutT (NUDIX family)